MESCNLVVGIHSGCQFQFCLQLQSQANASSAAATGSTTNSVDGGIGGDGGGASPADVVSTSGLTSPTITAAMQQNYLQLLQQMTQLQQQGMCGTGKGVAWQSHGVTSFSRCKFPILKKKLIDFPLIGVRCLVTYSSLSCHAFLH